jgi:dynein assembly factor 6, axonemal
VQKSAAGAGRGAAAAAGAGGTGTGAGAGGGRKDIWDDAEVAPPAEEEDGVSDGRRRPEYDVLFKQSVGSGDVFLGMSGVTPSSTHCDTLVVRVKLGPGARAGDIDLDVTEYKIRVATATHRLATGLPARVRHKDARAAWDGDKGVLTVTLPIVPTDPVAAVTG